MSERPGARAAGRPLSVLLLCDAARGHAATVLDQIAAFRRYSRHRFAIFNPLRVARSRSLDLDEFDVVVIHYSIFVISDAHLAPSFREKLRAFRGPKIQLIQDDYRRIDEMAAMMRQLEIDVLYTLYPEREIHRVWGESRLPGVEVRSYLAGYVSENLLAIPNRPIEERPIDIGYRGRVVPFWLGWLGQEKVWIGRGVLERAADYGLRCDIAWREEDRIYGRHWIEFLRSCKANLGTESGASITDFDGSVERAVKAYLVARPTADFLEVHREVLLPHEDNVRINVISPRIFEAAALGTGLILFPGEYSGIVEPWVHYLPLAKDFSNMAEVVEALRDLAGMKARLARARADLIDSGRFSFERFVEEFDGLLVRLGRPRASRFKPRFHVARMERALHPALRVVGRQWRNLYRLFAALHAGLAPGPLRKALLRHCLHPALWKRAPWEQIVPDLLRYGLLRRAQAGQPAGSEVAYRAAVSFAGERGALCFVSHAIDGDGKAADGSKPGRLEPAVVASLAAATLEGRLAGIAWSHGAVAGPLRIEIPAFGSDEVSLGDHDVYDFRGLAGLAALYPGEMLEAVLPLAAEARSEQVAAAMRENANR